MIATDSYFGKKCNLSSRTNILKIYIPRSLKSEADSRHDKVSWLRDMHLVDMFVMLVVRIPCVTPIRDTTVFNPDLSE